MIEKIDVESSAGLIYAGIMEAMLDMETHQRLSTGNFGDQDEEFWYSIDPGLDDDDVKQQFRYSLNRITMDEAVRSNPIDIFADTIWEFTVLRPDIIAAIKLIGPKRKFYTIYDVVRERAAFVGPPPDEFEAKLLSTASVRTRRRYQIARRLAKIIEWLEQRS